MYLNILNMPYYVWISLSMSKYNSIFVNMPKSSWMAFVLLVPSFPLERVFSYFNEVYSLKWSLQVLREIMTIPLKNGWKLMLSNNRLWWKNARLQLHFYNRWHWIIDRMDDCNWNYESTQYLWKRGWLQVLDSKKHCLLKTPLSLQVASWNNDVAT